MKKTVVSIIMAAVAYVAFADALSLVPAVPTSAWTYKWWLERFDAKKAEAAKGGYQVVFVGDSITHYWETTGADVWAANYADGEYKAFNAGFSGDRTENVLWRLENGMLDGLDPKAVVLMIGTNNIGHRKPEHECAFDTFCGIQAIVEELEKKFKGAKIIVHPIFPRGATPKDPLRRRCDAVNMMVADWIARRHSDATIANREKPGSVPEVRVVYCDFNAKLVDEKGTLSPEMAKDLLHPGKAGYEIWAMELKPWLDFALGKRKAPAAKRTYSCPTDIATSGPAAATAKSQAYWLTGLKGRDMRYRTKVNEIADNPSLYYDIVMLGDSITHFWEKPLYVEHFKKTFAGYSVLNLAFGGHHTGNVLWNVTDGGFLDRFQTRLFTLMIGTNNSNDSAEDTALGIRKILDALAAKQPNAKVLLMPILPRYRWPKGENAASYLPGSPERLRNEKVNELIRPFADGKRVIWCDFSAKFDPNGDGIPPKELLGDGTHPSVAGFDIFAEALMPVIKRELGR